MSSPDPTRRFATRVADYVRYRPRYPAAVIPTVAEATGLQPSWVVADVGSGTGFSAELFLSNGNEVFAVEPNEAMRRAAEALYGGDERFHSLAGRAEATGLDAGSIDLVVAGQAFHWFDAQRAREHFRAILRPPRWVVLLWNRRRTEGSAFLKDYEALLDEFGTDYHAVRHDRIDPAVLDSFYGQGFVRRTLPNEQVFDWQGLRGRLLSSSYTPAPDDARHAPMLERLRDVYDRHHVDGRVRIEYDTEICIGRLGLPESSGV